jgi:hypothetical protein
MTGSRRDIALKRLSIVLGVVVLAVGLRLWSTRDEIQSGESSLTLSYVFAFLVFAHLIVLIAFANTWRRRSDPSPRSKGPALPRKRAKRAPPL